MENVTEVKRKRGLMDGGEIQKKVDKEVIRLMSPYTPYDQGALVDSPNRMTVLGSGLVLQGGESAPYARRWYYNKEGAHFIGGKTDHWFAKAMRNGGAESILKQIQKMVGGNS